MPTEEMEGDWVMEWPSRKRPALTPGKDAEGRVINGRSPVTEIEGLITPTDTYYDAPGGTHKIVGRAWSGMGRIVRVEASTDGGKTCADAHIEEPREKWLWVRSSHLWEANEPGEHRLMAPATDETGRVQPQVPWNYQRKHFDDIVPTIVVVR